MSDNRERPILTPRRLPEGVTQADDGALVHKQDPKPSTGTATVTVASKLPFNLILRLFRMEDFTYPYGGGYKTLKEAVRMEEAGEYVINGTGIPVAAMRNHVDIDKIVISGAALTPGIPKDFWDKWYHDNQKSDYVKNGLIFAADNDERARAMAKERVKVKSGLEPIDPDNPGERLSRSRYGLEVQPGNAATNR
jgi:hypothetical protein